MLVDVESFELVLGYELDASQAARAEKVLELVSGEVQAYCNAAQLSRVTADIVRLRGSWSKVIKVPGAPVHDIASVDVDDEIITDFDFTRHGLLIAPDGWGGPRATVTVEYDHGFETVPSDVQSVVISRAMRMFVNPHAVMQAKHGADYSVSYAADAEMITGLNRSERMTLNRYRKTVS